MSFPDQSQARTGRPKLTLTSARMTTATPSKTKEKERIVNLIRDSIVRLCKFSFRGPGEIEVDGIVCITQPSDPDIVVKVHETFSSEETSRIQDEDGKSHQSGDKRKAGSHGDGKKTPRADGGRQKTPVRRRLIGSDKEETLDLTGDDECDQKPRKNAHRSSRSCEADVVDLTSGRDTRESQLHITQVRSLARPPPQNLVISPDQYSQNLVNYSPRGRGSRQRRPRQRGARGRGDMMPPSPHSRYPNQASVSPRSGPMPFRGFARSPNPNMPRPSGSGRGKKSPFNANIAKKALWHMGSPGALDTSVDSYKVIKCKYRDCDATCPNKYYLETHILQQHLYPLPFPCNEGGCDFKSQNKQNLYEHYRVVHGAPDPQFCIMCMKAFSSPETLSGHPPHCELVRIRCFDHCGKEILGLGPMAKHLAEAYSAEATSYDGRAEGPVNPNQEVSVPSPGHRASTSFGLPDLPYVSSQTSNQGDLAREEFENVEPMSIDIKWKRQSTEELQQDGEAMETKMSPRSRRSQTQPDSFQTAFVSSISEQQPMDGSREESLPPQLPQVQTLSQPSTGEDEKSNIHEVTTDTGADPSPAIASVVTLDLGMTLVSEDNDSSQNDDQPLDVMNMTSSI